MSLPRQISLAIPTHNRFEMVLECVADVIDDPRIDEIVLSDDCSDNGSFEKLVAHFTGHPKVRLYRNKRNLDCYFNKQQAVERSSNQWCILFDDDNILTRSYLDTLYSVPEWNPQTVYCPDWAQPHFDYRRFSGWRLTKNNIAGHMRIPHFKCALNTCNYFVNRHAYLSVWDGSVNPHTSDSMFQLYNWLKSGRDIKFLTGLRYFHRIHPGSHYRTNHKKTGSFAKELEQRLATLR